MSILIYTSAAHIKKITLTNKTAYAAMHIIVNRMDDLEFVQNYNYYNKNKSSARAINRFPSRGRRGRETGCIFGGNAHSIDSIRLFDAFPGSSVIIKLLTSYLP